MTTWADFLADLRSDLRDTSATPRFSDAMLYLYTRDSILDYSTYFPKMIVRAELTTNGSVYDLPSDYLEDVTVECPQDRFLERRQTRPGRRYPVLSRPTTYHISGGVVELNGPTSDPVLLSYMAVHPFPASVTDTTFVFTVPDRDLELLRLYVKGKVNEQIRTAQAQLDRFKLGSGDRQDNPLEPEVENLMLEYRRKISERVSGKTIRLWRPGMTI